MAELNRVLLIGNLTQDPELRYTPSQVAVSDLRLAVNRSWSSKDGERREDTVFLDVTVWNRQAENCCQFLRKGSPVFVEGYLRMDSWDDKTTGEKRTKIKVEAERVQFLGRPREEAGTGPADEFSSPAREPRRGAADGRSATGNGPSHGGYPPATSGPARRPAAPSGPEAQGEDDIPF
jgi:single-strand DNA-binding protein